MPFTPANSPSHNDRNLGDWSRSLGGILVNDLLPIIDMNGRWTSHFNGHWPLADQSTSGLL